TPATYNDTPYHFLMVPNLPMPFLFSYTKVGDYLVVATDQVTLRGVIDRANGAAALADSEGYRWVMAHLDSGPGFVTVYDDIPRILAAIVPVFVPMMIQGINQELGTAFTPADFPNAQVFLDYQKPGAIVVEASDDALEIRSYGTGMTAGDFQLIAPVVAAVAVPNFIEAKSRSSVASTRGDLRALSIALEMYCVDSNAYPESATGAGGVNSHLGPTAAAYGLPSLSAEGGCALTTPIAYIVAVPADPQSPDEGASLLYHQATERRDYLVFAAGPDGDYDIS
ncbi:unnamed protein product, partial [marine sediment metagenome]